MADKNRGRRLLAALADSTPAFTETGLLQTRPKGLLRRFLASLADDFPAYSGRLHFSASPDQDEDLFLAALRSHHSYALADGLVAHRSNSDLDYFARRFSVLSAPERLTARAWLPLDELRSAKDLCSIAILARSAAVFAGLQQTSDETRITNLPAMTRAARLLHEHILKARHPEILELDYLAQELDSTARRASVAPSNGLLVTVGARATNLEGAAAGKIRGLFGALPPDLSSYDPRINMKLYDNFYSGLSRDVARLSDIRGIHSSDVMNLYRAFIEGITIIVDYASDMSGADLRNAYLAQIPLDGVRWSSSTSWPANMQDTIAEESIELGDGVFEIQRSGRSRAFFQR
jgi:hypothetical protein